VPGAPGRSTVGLSLLHRDGAVCAKAEQAPAGSPRGSRAISARSLRTQQRAEAVSVAGPAFLLQVAVLARRLGKPANWSMFHP
jgi:hypothetical protein